MGDLFIFMFMERTNVNNNNNEDGIPIHVQVRKIKQEIEKIYNPRLQQLEIRPEITSQYRFRSPLGVAKRSVYVGN